MAALQRHPSLIPLSHDHHLGLMAAQRLKRGDPAYMNSPSVAESVIELWERELQDHFRDEEEIVFASSGYRPEVQEKIHRALTEHNEMRYIVEQCRNGHCSPDTGREFGLLLERHIRFEERELFGEIQADLDGGLLEEIGERIREERSMRIPPQCNTP